MIVVDEFGNEYTSTYAKRAKGLVKNGRARWLDGNIICLVCPPDELNLEDNEMENRAENMEAINEVCESEVSKTEQFAITTSDILRRIDQIIAQGNDLPHIVANIKTMPVNESPEGGRDGAARAEAIRDVYVRREVTNQKLIELLNRMYDDIAPKQVPIDPREKVLEALSKLNLGNVFPDTAKVMMEFMKDSLM